MADPTLVELLEEARDAIVKHEANSGVTALTMIAHRRVIGALAVAREQEAKSVIDGGDVKHWHTQWRNLEHKSAAFARAEQRRALESFRDWLINSSMFVPGEITDVYIRREGVLAELTQRLSNDNP